MGQSHTRVISAAGASKDEALLNLKALITSYGYEAKLLQQDYTNGKRYFIKGERRDIPIHINYSVRGGVFRASIRI